MGIAEEKSSQLRSINSKQELDLEILTVIADFASSIFIILAFYDSTLAKNKHPQFYSIFTFIFLYLYMHVFVLFVLIVYYRVGLNYLGSYLIIQL